MDKKKALRFGTALALFVLLAAVPAVRAQSVAEIQFCDKKYEYEVGKDSITLFFNVIDADRARVRDISTEELDKYLVIRENDTLITSNRGSIRRVSSGRRIPNEYTFSVLVDLSIPQSGKEQIYEAVSHLVSVAPDSCVYVSFFGDGVSSSVPVSEAAYPELKSGFSAYSERKNFYSALYAKLMEFDSDGAESGVELHLQPQYERNAAIALRARENRDKNILFVFTEGRKRPDDESVGFLEVTDYQSNPDHIVPRVFAFYYTEDGQTPDIETTLRGICSPRNLAGELLPERSGGYMPSDDMVRILEGFEQVVNDAMYDFAFVYRAAERSYTGKVTYSAEWKGLPAGQQDYSIGSAETPWPLRAEDAGDSAVKFLVAFAAVLAVVVFFLFVMKVAIPFFRARAFAVRYYKKYVPEENVQRRICHYCKQEIRDGQRVVTKCRHIMHVHCWQENGYKCAEYGQNCKTGVQSHVEWREICSLSSLRDCSQTLAGIGAGFVSWLVYELAGRGCFEGLSAGMVRLFFTNEEQFDNLFQDCVNKTSAFLTIGLLLGFFLSLIFRYNDEYRKKNWKVWAKIILLSLLTALIGMASFAVGADIFCSLLSAAGTTYIPWYCSFPGYLLFSICVSLALTVKSTIPVRSALAGGVCSSVIGFIVLYFAEFASSRWGWMNLLLDFTIYGGGLGASLVTVRMLSEKFFLDIRNGVRAGQRIPIHKWMNAVGGGNKVTIGMTGECEIQMNWEKSNKVAKEHAQLYIDHKQQLPKIKPLATGVVFNTRTELPVGKPMTLSNGDTIKIGDTVFQYVETE